MAELNKISKNILRITIDNPSTPNDKLYWINIFNAGKAEIEYLRKNFNFNLNHLQASSSKISAQRPSIEYGDGYLFLILHFPVMINGQIIPEEVDFFINHGHLITLHNNHILALNDFFNLCKKDESSFLAYQNESSAVLLYELLGKLMLGCYPILDKNSIDIYKVEEEIFANEQKSAVAGILSLRHNIINFRKIIQNHKNILKKLMEMESTVIHQENIKNYYAELVEHSKTIWEILDNQKEMVEVLYQTNESLLNYKLNDVIKTLTVFSVILYPLMLIASIFGMNTVKGMPLVDSDYGFWVLLCLMVLSSLGMLLFFKKKKWL